MTQEHDHPITPPRELMQQWIADSPKVPIAHGEYIATQAARWGADQELEACCKWLLEDQNHGFGDNLRVARRPKPPSLKEQALAVLEDAFNRLDAAHENIIRRAIEALPDES